MTQIINVLALMPLWLLEVVLRGLRAVSFNFWKGTKIAHLSVKRAQERFRVASLCGGAHIVLVEHHGRATHNPTPNDPPLINEDPFGTEHISPRCEACLSEGPLASLLYCPMRHTICADCLLGEGNHSDRRNVAPACPQCASEGQLSVEQEGLIAGEEEFSDVDRTLELFAEFAAHNVVHDGGEIAFAPDNVHDHSFVFAIDDGDESEGDEHTNLGQFDIADHNARPHAFENTEDGCNGSDDRNDDEDDHTHDTSMKLWLAMQQCIEEIETAKERLAEKVSTSPFPCRSPL